MSVLGHERINSSDVTLELLAGSGLFFCMFMFQLRVFAEYLCINW